MTEQNQISLPDEVLNTILTGSLDGLPEAVSLLINHAMLILDARYEKVRIHLQAEMRAAAKRRQPQAIDR
jgi:hypothetical protein